MLFTSYQFLGFLAILFPAYYLVPRRMQQPLLLGASWLFYLAAGPKFLLYILTTSVTVYLAGRAMGRDLEEQSAYLKAHKDELSREEKRAYKEGRKRVLFRWFLGCLLLNLGILAVVKYVNFVIANVNGLLSALGGGELSFLTLALPLGISFYTFQAVGYLIDVYRGTVAAERSFLRFALFVSFFPQLIQGPISRYGDLAPSLCAPHPYDAKAVSRGLQRMLWGYFKKLVIADRILAAVSTIVGAPEEYRGALKEYWRRWHISMCAWFRDYVFYPVSISPWMRRFTKFAKEHFGEEAGRRLPVYLSSFLVWLATGVWHGASWNFIVWGLANYVVLMLSEELEPAYGRFHRRFPALGGAFPYRLFQVGRTFLLVCVLNLFDCYHSLAETFGSIVSMFTVGNWHVFWDGSLLDLGLSPLDYGILAAGTAVMLGVSLVQRGGGVREGPTAWATTPASLSTTNSRKSLEIFQAAIRHGRI